MPRAGVAKQKNAVEFVFSILPFTRTFQLKQKVFFFLFCLPECFHGNLGGIKCFNSEHQLLKFSDSQLGPGGEHSAYQDGRF